MNCVELVRNNEGELVDDKKRQNISVSESYILTRHLDSMKRVMWLVNTVKITL